MQVLYHQLVADRSALAYGYNVSDAALKAPRYKSSRCEEAKTIAKQLFPCDPEKWCYIQYQRLIRDLARIYKLQQNYKQSTISTPKTHSNFCTLKILEPTAMPVNVANVKELEPFFDFLKNDRSIDSAIGESNIKIDKNFIEFIRGAFYKDGRIDLCKQVVGPPHISALMKSLETNTQMKHFLLGNNIIGKNGGIAISDYIKKSKEIETWYLAGNDLDAESIKLISEALTFNGCLYLWLKRNPIKYTGSIHLSKLLAANTKLKLLDLSNTGLLDEGTIEIFTSLLAGNTNLRHLYLGANGITTESVNAMCKYFQNLIDKGIKGLTSLWLDMNRLGEEKSGKSIIPLIRVLGNYSHLKRLIISSNRLTSVAANEIYLAFKNHSNLKFLDLGIYKATRDLGESPNCIGDQGAGYIADLLKDNKSIEVINISFNDITEIGLQKISKAMKDNTTVLTIFLYQSPGITNIENEIKNKFIQNVKNKYNIEYPEFVEKKLRFIRCGKKIEYIDSIYRNNKEPTII
jgi:NLR family CARD domain-containing protein 3